MMLPYLILSYVHVIGIVDDTLTNTLTWYIKFHNPIHFTISVLCFAMCLCLQLLFLFQCMKQSGDWVKGKMGCSSFKGDCSLFRYGARFYPPALWVRYHVPMRLLGLWCCRITQQVYTQDLLGESAGAGGMGECLGNCGIVLVKLLKDWKELVLRLIYCNHLTLCMSLSST